MTRLKKILLTVWVALLLSGCVPPANLLLTAEPSPTATTQATAAASPTAQLAAPEPTPEGAWMRPQPASGTPGASVQIEGFLPGGLPKETLDQENYVTHASICWGGCKTGLMEDGLEVHWSRTEPGRFEMQFTVPSAPWLSRDGIHQLEVGDYSLELIYLDPTQYGCKSPNGCALVPAAVTSFHLTQPAVHQDCTPSQCGSLVPSLTQAGPGEVVQVQGWAPLLEIIGAPMGYNLVIVSNDPAQGGQVMGSFPVQQAMDGSLSGAFQVPQMGYYGLPLAAGSYTLALDASQLRLVKGSPPVLVNGIPFAIRAAPAWTDQPHPQPLWIQPSVDMTDSSIAADPLRPERMAYCAPGKILVTEDGGKSWLTFLTIAVAQLPTDSAVALDGAAAQGGNTQLPLCDSVTLDPNHPDSAYATFGLVNKEYGPPPIYPAGYYTTDRGKTWQAAPVPAVKMAGQQVIGLFGWFWTGGKTVQALYYQTTENEYTPSSVQAKETSDGGLTWNPAPLACPASGPCLRWDAGPAMTGGMGADMPQRVVASADHGRTWQATGQSADLRQDGPHELVALSDHEAVLLSGTNSFPMRYTADGGQTWQSLALPELPTGTSGTGAGFRGLQMLPDGRLLAMRSNPDQWMALMPGAKDWCQVHFTSASAAPLLFHVVGNQVWWLDSTFQQAKSGPLNQFECK